MYPENLKQTLCEAFCGAIDVRAVPSGLAISSAFEDSSGDRISFYLTETPDGYAAEDDGSYLADLVARDIPITQGTRGQILDDILAQSKAYWDRETYEIRTEPFTSADDLPSRVIAFISSLIRVRDLELITRENVRSTFYEDAIDAMRRFFSSIATIETDTVVDKEFSDFPADVIIRPHRGLSAEVGAIYLINSTDKLNEALLHQLEATSKHRADVKVLALLEDPEMKLISRRKFQRAQNRSLPIAIFRGDEDAAMRKIGGELRLPHAA